MKQKSCGLAEVKYTNNASHVSISGFLQQLAQKFYQKIGIILQ